MRKNIQAVIEEMERWAQLAMEQLPEAVREEMQEFDHQQELSERRWKKHRDTRPLCAGADHPEEDSAERAALEPGIRYRFEYSPEEKERLKSMSREERLRRQDSWNQIKAKTRVKSDGVSRLLTEIFSQSPEDLAQLMSDSRLTHAIGALTGLQRQVLFLEFVERYTTREIAAMLGSSSRNIRARRQTALTRLRKALEEIPDPRYKKEET